MVLWSNMFEPSGCRVSSFRCECRALATGRQCPRLRQHNFHKVNFAELGSQWAKSSGPSQSAVVADLINGRVVDTLTVVVAQVVIVIALILSADGDQVVALQDGNIVSEGGVMAIPEALAGVLRIHVVRNQSVGRFAADFKRSAQAG